MAHSEPHLSVTVSVRQPDPHTWVSANAAVFFPRCRERRKDSAKEVGRRTVHT